MTTTRVVMVGLDSVFQPIAFHRAAAADPHTEVVACCDLGVPDEVVRRDLMTIGAAEYAAQRGLRLTRSLDDLLDHEFDAAFLCSRNAVMPGLAGRLIDAGKHLFVAKPMALTFDGVDAYERARDRGVICASGVLGRAWDPMPRALGLAAEGRIGRLLSMDYVHQHGKYVDVVQDTALGDRADGTLLNWFGWYAADVVVAALGPIRSVFGAEWQSVPNRVGMPDQGAAIFEAADGRRATARLYFAAEPEWRLPANEIELVGEQGVIRYRGGTHIEVVTSDQVQLVAAPDSADFATPVVSAFLAAVRGEGEPLMQLDETLHVARATIAWKESADRGAPVEVPHFKEFAQARADTQDGEWS